MSDPAVNSVQDLINEAGGKLSAKKCDRCQTQFMLSDLMMLMATDDPQHFQIDVGGYCQTCHQFVCPQHIKLIPMVKAKVVRHLLNGDTAQVPADILSRVEFYWLGCDKCTALLDLGTDSDNSVVVFWDPTLAE